MSRSLTAQDRSALIKLASTLPKGSKERIAILASVKKTGGKWKAYPLVGQTYTVGYRSSRWLSTFLGWKLEGGEPYMMWKDAPSENYPEGLEWKAYISDGVVVVGSSADPLIIYRK